MTDATAGWGESADHGGGGGVWRAVQRSLRGVDESATFTSGVERRGILSLGTELGGWGRVSIEGVRIAERGLRNILRHFGVVEGTSETGQRDTSPGTRHMMVRDPSCYVFAPSSGLFEPYHLVFCL